MISRSCLNCRCSLSLRLKVCGQKGYRGMQKLRLSTRLPRKGNTGVDSLLPKINTIEQQSEREVVVNRCLKDLRS